MNPYFTFLFFIRPVDLVSFQVDIIQGKFQLFYPSACRLGKCHKHGFLPHHRVVLFLLVLNGSEYLPDITDIRDKTSFWIFALIKISGPDLQNGVLVCSLHENEIVIQAEAISLKGTFGILSRRNRYFSLCLKKLRIWEVCFLNLSKPTLIIHAYRFTFPTTSKTAFANALSSMSSDCFQ